MTRARRAQPGSIIVMHINHVRFHTAEALPDILSGLRARGYALVTVGQLLAEEHARPGAEPPAGGPGAAR